MSAKKRSASQAGLSSSKLLNKKVAYKQSQTSPSDLLWISASATRNYLLKDPCLDWLRLYACDNQSLSEKMKSYAFTIATFRNSLATTVFSSTMSTAASSAFSSTMSTAASSAFSSTMSTAASSTALVTNFSQYIITQGNRFEENIVRLLQDKFGSHFCSIATTAASVHCPQKQSATLQAILAGTPIIHSAVLHHSPSRTFGIPDLLVRSDYLAQLVEIAPLSLASSKISAPRLQSLDGQSSNYHYVVIDIKYTSLKLRADGLHLLNAASIPAYKGQLYIYNRALAELQGYDPGVAYLLGRKWSYTSKDQLHCGDGCFERLGAVDFGHLDRPFVELTEEAVSWCRELRADGAKWDITIPHRIELYPNLSARQDWPWGKLKKELAHSLSELTMLWMCGSSNRQIAHAHGITRWDDQRLTPELLGIGLKTLNNTSTILSKMLAINHPHCDEMIRPAQMQIATAPVRLYVDFEGIGASFEDFSKMPAAGGRNCIFMIGAGYLDQASGEWVYRNFSAENFSPAEEERIALQFVEYVKGFEGNVSLLHWSHYEPSQWDKLAERYPSLYRACCDWNGEWLDLLRLFKEQQVVIKGALNYGLKEIVGALHRHGALESCYDNSLVTDGEDAMLKAYYCGQEALHLGLPMSHLPAMAEIVAYNDIDCKVMMELMKFVRVGGA